jgi:hypothetical protein
LRPHHHFLLSAYFAVFASVFDDAAGFCLALMWDFGGGIAPSLYVLYQRYTEIKGGIDDYLTIMRVFPAGVRDSGIVRGSTYKTKISAGHFIRTLGACRGEITDYNE